MSNENIENVKKFFTENENEVVEVDGFGFENTEFGIIVYVGLDKYVLEKQLAENLGLHNSSNLNNLYKKPVEKGLINLETDRLELTRKQTNHCMKLLGKDRSPRKYNIIKHVSAVYAVSKSGSKSADKAEEMLVKLANVGSKALVFKEKVVDKDLCQTKEMFKKGIKFISENDPQEYNELKLATRRKGATPLDKGAWKLAKSHKSVTNGHSLTVDVEDAKKFEKLTEEEIDYIFEIKQHVLEGRI